MSYRPAFAASPRLPRRHPTHRARPPPRCNLRLADKKILVTGATGPTGRLICGALHARGAKVRALIRPRTYLRDRRRVDAVRQTCPDVEYVMGDLRDAATLEAAVRGCQGVISASGTRNFEGSDPNRPEVVDYLGVRRLADCFLESQLEQDLVMLLSDEVAGEGERPAEEGAVATEAELINASRFVLVSSLGVTKPERFPQLQQMGGMMTYKACGEDAVRASGCPFTIVRPGGFNDAPPGQTRIVVDQGDRVVGTISRADVAEICAEAIFRQSATNVTFECIGASGLGEVADGGGGFDPAMFEGLKLDDMYG